MPACLAGSITANAQDQSSQHRPTSADLSRDETPAKTIMRAFEFQEYDIRSAAEAVPEDKWDFNAEHYGQLAISLRLNGIVPPSSRNLRPKPQEKY